MASQVSVAQQVGAWAGLLVGLALAGLLVVLMWHKPFGIQAPALVIYTAGVFFFLFRDYDSSNLEAYSLRQKAVRQKIPQLLAIHAVFLVVVFTAVTIAFSLRPYLPPSWTAGEWEKRRTWFDQVLVLIGAVPMLIQLYISRRILSRSVKAAQTN